MVGLSNNLEPVRVAEVESGEASPSEREETSSSTNTDSEGDEAENSKETTAAGRPKNETAEEKKVINDEVPSKDVILIEYIIDFSFTEQ